MNNLRDLSGITKSAPSGWSIRSIRGITQKKKEIGYPDEELLSVYRDYGVIIKSSRDDNHNQASSDLSKYQLVRPGELVINKMKAWQGSLGVSLHRGIISPAYIVCRIIDKKIDSKYLNYYLRSKHNIATYNALSYGVRVGQWDMHYEDYKNIYILLPPEDVQREIVSYLDDKLQKIDLFIKNKEHYIQKLHERKQSSINKIICNGIERNVQQASTGCEWAPTIPRHWDFEKLRHLAVQIGRGTTASYVVYSDVKIVNQSTFSKGFFDSENMSFQDPSVSSNLSARIKKGDVLLASTGGGVLGKVWFFDQSNNDHIVADSHVTILRFNNISVAKYVYYFLSINYELINGVLAQGATNQIELQAKWLKNFRVPIPPKDELCKILRFIEDEILLINKAIAKAQHQIELTKEYRESLITHAVSGQIKIGE